MKKDNKHLHISCISLVFAFALGVLSICSMCINIIFRNNLPQLKSGVVTCMASYGDEDLAGEYISDFYQTLPEDFNEEVLNNPTEAVGIKAIIADLFAAFESERSGVLSFFLFLLGMCFLMAVIESCSLASDELVLMGICAVGAGAMFSRLYPLVDAVKASVSELSSFFGALVPVVSGVAISHGAPNTALIGATGMSFVLWLLGGVGASLLMTLCVAVFCTSFLSSMSEELSSLSASVSGAFMKLVGIIGAVIGAVSSFQCFVAASADTAAMRAAKYAAQTLIPVVGSTVSGAMSTLSGGLAYVSGVIGAGAALVILSLVSVLLIRLLLYRLAMFVVGFFLDLCSARSTKACVSGLTRALDGLICVYVLTSVVYVFEVIVILKSASSVV